MKLNEFEQHNWHAFQGCVRWYGKNNEGCEPLFGEGLFADGKRFCLVLDPTGGTVLVEGDEQNDYGGYVLTMDFPTQATAMTFAEGIGEPKSLQDFLRLGFIEI